MARAPFAHPAIATLIRTVVWPRTIPSERQKYFSPMPPATVALAATAVSNIRPFHLTVADTLQMYAAISQYATGRCVSQDFRESQARPIYRKYLKMLKKFRNDEKRCVAYKNLMVSYYDYCA
jgi:hypothetical protein